MWRDNAEYRRLLAEEEKADRLARPGIERAALRAKIEGSVRRSRAERMFSRYGRPTGTPLFDSEIDAGLPVHWSARYMYDAEKVSSPAEAVQMIRGALRRGNCELARSGLQALKKIEKALIAKAPRGGVGATKSWMKQTQRGLTDKVKRACKRRK